MCPGKRKVIQGSAGFNPKPLFVKEKCIKKRKFVSINVLTKMLQMESEKERVAHDHQTLSKKLVDPFIDDPQVKNTLSNWRKIKDQGRQHEREEARLKLEKIQNTACFNDSTDAMSDFHKLIGCSNGSILPTHTQSCFICINMAGEEQQVVNQ